MVFTDQRHAVRPGGKEIYLRWFSLRIVWIGGDVVAEGEAAGEPFHRLLYVIVIPVVLRGIVVDHYRGPEGLGSLIDSVADTGADLLLWRTTCSGSTNYPSRVPLADAYYSLSDGPRAVDFRGWDTLGLAVEHAHLRGLEIWAWYDQTDSHGGCGGERRHNQFILQHPHCTRKPLPGGLASPVEVAEHEDPSCPLRGQGTQGSLSYPEVQDFRLALVREAVGCGVDGMYLVDGGYIGYEEPVVDGFRQQHGIAPHDLPPEDPRWAAHQGQVLTGYLERVRAAIDTAGRPVALALETRGPRKSLPGLRPYAARAAPGLLESGTLDYLSVWVAEDVLELRRLGVALPGVVRRFEITAAPEAWWLLEGARVMEEAGVGVFSVDEAPNIEPDGWGVVTELCRRHGK